MLIFGLILVVASLGWIGLVIYCRIATGWYKTRWTRESHRGDYP